jgi:hypothetical protein
MIAQVDDYRPMHNARTYDAEATHTMSWLLNRGRGSQFVVRELSRFYSVEREISFLYVSSSIRFIIITFERNVFVQIFTLT